MLVLSRKDGESLKIGEDIEILVLRSRGSRVQLGIKAPRDVTIKRSELLDFLRLSETPDEERSLTEAPTASAS